ncbi:MAG: PfkB domain protein [Solirubrobacterales bacterium]|nr:PfkB domain protein [Solirubrobacterales bacterium]
MVYAYPVHATHRRAPAGQEPRHRATGPVQRTSPGGRFDYTTVGHVTVDVMADGTRRPGGSAFYSALQASRLGLRALILTRGRQEEIEALLEPYRGELAIEIQPSRQTTTLHTSGSGATRSQRLLAWAGPIEGEPVVDSAILHLAPVARESPRRWRGETDFVGLTPQGLVRQWAGNGGEISLTPVDLLALPATCDAIVISEVERDSCAALLSSARKVGAVVAITAGHRPTTILLPDGETLHAPTQPTEEPGEDVGAGDVFAAAFFIALGEGQQPKPAVAFAGAAAALRIGAAGTSGIADRSAVESRVRAAAVP